MSILDSVNNAFLLLNPLTSGLLFLSGLSGCSVCSIETESSETPDSAFDCSDLSKYDVGNQTRTYWIRWKRMMSEEGKAGISQKHIEDFILQLNQSLKFDHDHDVKTPPVQIAEFKLASVDDIPGDEDINYKTKLTVDKRKQLEEVLSTNLSQEGQVGKASTVVILSSGSLFYKKSGETSEGYVGKIYQGGIANGLYVYLSQKANAIALIHEIGHVFGLQHSWLNKNLETMNAGNVLNCVDSECHPVVCDESNQITYNPKNYMSYSKCQETFDPVDYKRMACVADLKNKNLDPIDSSAISEYQPPTEIRVRVEESIQAAIETASLNFGAKGGTILIEEGTYLENIEMAGIEVPLTLKGDGQVIIDGSKQVNRNVLYVANSGSLKAKVKFENLTFTGGKTATSFTQIYKIYLLNSYIEMKSCQITGPYLGGLAALNSHITLETVEIHRLLQKDRWVIDGFDSNITIRNSSFHQNQTAGNFSLLASKLQVEHSVFWGNQFENFAVSLEHQINSTSPSILSTKNIIWDDESQVCVKSSQDGMATCHDLIENDIVCTTLDASCQ